MSGRTATKPRAHSSRHHKYTTQDTADFGRKILFKRKIGHFFDSKFFFYKVQVQKKDIRPAGFEPRRTAIYELELRGKFGHGSNPDADRAEKSPI